MKPEYLSLGQPALKPGLLSTLKAEPYKKGKLLNSSDGGGNPDGFIFTENEWQILREKDSALQKTSSYVSSHPHFVKGGDEIKKLADSAGLSLESQEVVTFF